jgi:hypothetical protein
MQEVRGAVEAQQGRYNITACLVTEQSVGYGRGLR